MFSWCRSVMTIKFVLKPSQDVCSLVWPIEFVIHKPEMPEMKENLISFSIMIVIPPVCFLTYKICYFPHWKHIARWPLLYWALLSVCTKETLLLIFTQYVPHSWIRRNKLLCVRELLLPIGCCRDHNFNTCFQCVVINHKPSDELSSMSKMRIAFQLYLSLQQYR